MKIGLIELSIFFTLAGLVASQNCKTYCYTRWLNRDRPSGFGDYEDIKHVSKKQVCCNPVGIECQTADGRPYNSTGNFLAHACTPRTGLICVNSHQKSGKQCEDYRLRYLCPQGSIQDKTGIECRTFCDTGFTDDDNPSGYCDCERGPSCPGGVAPAGIRCLEVKTNKDYKQLGQNITCQPDKGGFCWNKDNPHGCRDYKVQYICPKPSIMPPTGTCNSGTENVAEIAEETFPDDEDDNEYNEEAEAEMVEEELGNVIEKSKEHLLLNELLHSLLDRKN